MAALVYSIIKDAWCFVSSPVDKVRNLEDNLESLKAAMVKLKETYEDVKQRVENEEELPQMKRTIQVSGWLEDVLQLGKEVDRILKDGEKQDQNKCLGGFCPQNCLSSYKLGVSTSKKLEEVEKLKTGGQFNVVVQKVHVPVQKMPMDETVGLDSILQNVWGCIEDQNLRIIGLYGTGGVGKSTLLHSINNEFLKVGHDFYVVILVVVSREQKVDMVQKTIMDKLGLSRDTGNPDSDQINARKIFDKLHGKKFLLLLDDIWEKLDLKLVGVPLPNGQNQSKVVLTTRSREVCGRMEANPKIEVPCLAQKEALHLFRMKVGEAILNSDPEISKLAEDMAAKCNGLPLALITVGGTMASRNHRHEWVSGLNILRNTPSEFQGMRDVFKLLKFSYEGLPSINHKSCFLYCCLFPENHEIRKEELIEYWIGEGFLDKYGEDANINGDLRPKGESIIEDLKRACLLGSGESEEFIRMHSMVRDMAWQECQEKIALLIKRDNEARGLSRWNEVERMSLWDHSMQDLLSKVLHPYSSIEDLLGNISHLPNLRTMICKDPMSKTLHATFFPLMSALRLLDLSNSSVLHELPTEIGQLINLEYLNLSDTAIPELPPALQNLTKMRCLILNYTNLQKIPEAMISNFKFLEVFSKLEILQPIHPDGSIQYLLEELERLQHIREICIAIHEATYSLQRLLGSQKLLGCIRKLTLDDCNDLRTSLELSPSLLRKMEDLQLRSCNKLRELRITPGTGHFDKLSKVVIKGCRFLSDVRWLIYARRLQTLELVFCESLGEIIGDEFGAGEIEENMEIFSRLLVLRLDSLPSLERICRHALPFPFLIKIEVQDCPLFKKLPFDSNSARNNLKLISGEESWWESLHWDDEAIKPFFSSKFQKLRPDQNQKDWFEDFGSWN